MSKDLSDTELIKILADLKGDSWTRLETIKRLGILEYSALSIVRALEQVVLHDPDLDIQKAALEVLNLPQHRLTHRRLSMLSGSKRREFADEIDLWSDDSIISPQVALLLKGRLGLNPVTKQSQLARIQAEPETARLEKTPPHDKLNTAPAVPVTIISDVTAEPSPELKAPPKEKVPFDQWLLSERNIKIALYTGGALLVLAGIIFIGVNWMRIPGPVKFAITLMVTGLMYLAGYLMYQKPLLKIGGVAVLGVASGFLPLIFAVLQIYILSLRGLADEVMWVIASPMCLLLYGLTAYWTRSKLFTFISLASVLSTAWAALVVSGALPTFFGVVFAVLFLSLLLLARYFQSTPFASFTRQPLLIVAHIGTPLAIIMNLVYWASSSGCYRYSYGCWEGSPWLALLGLTIGATFYLVADRLFKVRLSRWLWALLFCGIIFIAFAEKNAPYVVFHYALLLIPVVYMGIGIAIERAEKSRQGTPLFLLAALVALACITSASVQYPINPTEISRALFVDVILLLAAEFLLHIKKSRWLTVFVLPAAFYFAFEAWHFNTLALGIAMMIMAFVYLGVGHASMRWEAQAWAHLPLYIGAYAIAVGLIFFTFQDSLALMLVLYLVVALLVATNLLLRRLEFRWVAAFLLPVPIYLGLALIHASQATMGISLMVLSLIYLGGGYALENWEKRKSQALPLYAAAYAIALLVTVQALPRTSSLIQVLFGDVILLILSAAIHRIYWWVYGAAWLFMLSVYLLINQLVQSFPNQGLLIGVLGLNYTAAGYILGRRALRLGAPFLLGAAYLSLIAVALSWESHPIASLVLAIVAILYLMVALWLGWSWLLPVTWLAVNLLSLSLGLNFFTGLTLFYVLTVTSAALGAGLLAGAWFVQRRFNLYWGLPLIIVGAVNLSVAYLVGIALGGWLAVGLSVLLTIYFLSFAWLTRVWIKIPILTCLGLAAFTIGYLFTIINLGGTVALHIWQVYAVALCAFFVLIAWLLRREPFTLVYSHPLRWVGLIAMLIPVLGSGALFEAPVFIAITCAIATLTYLGDAALRRVLNLAYIGLGALVLTIWAVLAALKISELQAYIFPLALLLIGIGWNENFRRHSLAYRLACLVGSLLLLVSAYIQSIYTDSIIYALLLLVECLVFLAVGIWQHRRIFVEVGGVALLVNAFTQLGPGFVELDRWIQMAMIGAVLFGLGLAALVKRQDILVARKKFGDTWREWEP